MKENCRGGGFLSLYFIIAELALMLSFVFFSSLLHTGPGAVHDGGNAASRVAAGLCLWATLLARLLLDF